MAGKGAIGKGQGNPKLVSLVKGNSRKENIKKALELIKDGLGRLLRARRILIKPNLTGCTQVYANTSAEACGAVVEFLRENHRDFRAAEITIGECSGGAYYSGCSTADVFRGFGYGELAKKYKNLRLMEFDNCTNFNVHEIETVIGTKTRLRVCRDIEKFDYVVSVAMPKTHNFAIITAGVKNMVGLVKKEDMALMHGLKAGSAPGAPRTLLDRLPHWFIPWVRRNIPSMAVDLFFMAYPNYRKSVKVIHKNLANVLKNYLPDLVVIDGFYGMEGNGPVNGDAVEMGLAMASTDAVKADGLAARVMGFAPESIGYLYYLEKAGFGDYSLKGLVGERPEKVARKFRPHGTYPVQAKWAD